MYDIIISGYYGFNNSGDEALLYSIIQDLRACKPDIKIAVLSQNPAQTSANYQVDAIERLKLFQVFRTMRHTRLLLSGGGSLIQDATSSKSLFYYLLIILLAKWNGLKVMLYANGVGPVGHKWNRRLAKYVLNKADFITLREPDSKEELDRMGVSRPPIEITADPAIRLARCPEEETDELLKKLGLEGSLAVISLRCWKDYDERIKEVLGETVAYLEKNYGVRSVFLPMQYAKDEPLCREIAKMGNAVVLPQECTVGQVLGLMSRSSLVIGMRLHAIIYASSVDAPAIGIVYDPKVRSYLRSIGSNAVIHVESLSFEGMKKLVDQIMRQGQTQNDMLQKQQKKAFRNAQIAVDLLGGTKN